MSKAFSFGVFGLMLLALVAHFWAEATGKPNTKRIAGIIKLTAYGACVVVLGIVFYDVLAHRILK